MGSFNSSELKMKNLNDKELSSYLKNNTKTLSPTNLSNRSRWTRII